MASLKKRIILSFIASLAIFLVFVSAIIVSGLNIALKGWYRASEARYSSAVVKSLEKLYSAPEMPGENDIRKSLEAHLKENFSLIVFSPDGRIIFSHNVTRPPFPPRMMGGYQGRMQPQPPEPGGFPGPGRRNMEMTGNQMMMPEMMDDLLRSLAPVRAGGRTLAFVWTRSSRFETGDTLNRQLLKSIVLVLLLGITASMGAAVLSTLLISGKVTREATAVSSGLENLASGKRDVLFPESSSNEIASISRSALVLQEKLIKEEEVRKQWTQDIAHDLRTPVAAIKAQLEAMIDGVLKPDSERLIKLLAEAGRLEALVEDINRLTNIESPGSVLDVSSVASGEIASILHERFGMLAHERGIRLSMVHGNFRIRCDAQLLTRALSNLVHNSIQYSPDKSEVKMTLENRGNDAFVTVENQGQIPESEIPRIFDRLYRGNFGRSSKGSGLGLTIARAAVEKHGGTIIAGNIESSGSRLVRFTVTLPGAAET